MAKLGGSESGWTIRGLVLVAVAVLAAAGVISYWRQHRPPDSHSSASPALAYPGEQAHTQTKYKIGKLNLTYPKTWQFSEEQDAAAVDYMTGDQPVNCDKGYVHYTIVNVTQNSHGTIGSLDQLKGLYASGAEQRDIDYNLQADAGVLKFYMKDDKSNLSCQLNGQTVPFKETAYNESFAAKNGDIYIITVMIPYAENGRPPADISSYKQAVAALRQNLIADNPSVF
jgi:hypothetical protein